MLYIVDGTGVWDDADYAYSMADGFCDRMRWQYPPATYVRGPSIDGVGTMPKAADVVAGILSNKNLGKQPLYLAGHSRGGAAVIRAAFLLSRANVQVDAMFLFDAVDKTATAGSLQRISDNVKNVYHARRDTSIQNMFEQDHAAADRAFRSRFGFDPETLLYQPGMLTQFLFDAQLKIKNPAFGRSLKLTPEDYGVYFTWYLTYMLDYQMKLRMRGSKSGFDFENCGQSGGQSYTERIFAGSHGAMGGSPIGIGDLTWNSPKDRAMYDRIIQLDMAAMSDAWGWMHSKFVIENLKDHNKNKEEKNPALGPMVGKWRTINYKPVKLVEFSTVKISPNGWGNPLMMAGPKTEYFELRWSGDRGAGKGIWLPDPNQPSRAYLAKIDAYPEKNWPVYGTGQPGFVFDRFVQIEKA